jgi:hypothetical protein
MAASRLIAIGQFILPVQVLLLMDEALDLGEDGLFAGRFRHVVNLARLGRVAARLRIGARRIDRWKRLLRDPSSILLPSSMGRSPFPLHVAIVQVQSAGTRHHAVRSVVEMR